MNNRLDGWTHAVIATAFLLATSQAGAQLRLVSRAVASAQPSSGGGASVLSGAPSSTTGGQSINPSQISADGRYVVFESEAPNLVAGLDDANRVSDVFLYDRVAATVTLVSQAAGQAQSGNSESVAPSVSADGAWVAFVSSATNLVTGFTAAGQRQVYLWSRLTGQRVLVSHASGTVAGASDGSAAERPALNDDGAYVAFRSQATNLVAGQVDTNGQDDVFLYARATHTNALVSHASGGLTTSANARSFSPALSADGSQVVYESAATNIVAGQIDPNGTQADIFLYARASGTNRLVSHALGAPATTGADESRSPSISADGGTIVFSSDAANLVAALDTPGTPDVFLFDAATGGLTLISHSAGAPGTAAGHGVAPVIDASGSVVAFVSEATSLVPGPGDPVPSPDVFVWMRADGTVRLASHPPGTPTVSAGQVGDTIADLRIAAQGRYVLYGSSSTALVAAADNNNSRDYFLYDRVSDTNRLVSGINGQTYAAAGLSGHASLSADGAYVAFDSLADNVITTGGVSDPNNATDVFVFDRVAGATVLATRHAPGQASASAGGDSVKDTFSAVSADGRYAVFTSDAEDLLPGGQDGNGGTDVFCADLVTGEIRLVSHSSGSESSAGPGRSYGPVISADGSRVAFLSEGTYLVPNMEDLNNGPDVFLWERATGQIRVVSHSAGDPLRTGDRPAAIDWLRISASGAVVAYESNATNLVPGGIDTNIWPDTYLYDLASDQNTLVNHAAGAPATTANSGATPGALSADGRYLVFVSGATNLLAGQVDTNGHLGDVFLYDRQSAATTLLTRASAGTPVTTANGHSWHATLSADGSKVAVVSMATDLMPGFVDRNGMDSDLFVVDRVSGVVSLASHIPAASTSGANAGADQPALSADGQWLVYLSRATDLVTGQLGGGERTAFLYSLASGQNVIVSHAAGTLTQAREGGGGTPAISADGAFVAFASRSETIVAGQVERNDDYDVFLYRRADGENRLLSRIPASPVDTGNGYSLIPSLSANGRTIVFYGAASDLTVRDFNARKDVFVAWNEQTPPQNPSSIQSTSHAPSIWSAQRSIVVQWSGASDPESGVAGYSVLFDTQPTTTPDTSIDVPDFNSPPDPRVGSAPLSDGVNHWFHLRTCDFAGNCSAPLHLGPYWIDATAPSAPTNVHSTSHTPGLPSSDPTIDVAWTAALDGLSGIDGYGIAFWRGAAPHCDRIKQVEEGTTTFTSFFESDGDVWVHVCAIDNAGNWGDVGVAGPYRIATNADLEVTQSASPEPVSALGMLTYTLTVTNHGGLDATGVVLTDSLPPGLVFVSSTPGAPTCMQASGVVTCNLGALAFGASSVVTIQATNVPGYTGTARNRVQVDGAEVDNNAINNRSEHNVRVVLEKGDLDNDAWADIFFRNTTTGRHVAWLMNGPVRQSAGFITPDPASPDWRLAVVHDVDGDQRNDLVFRNEVTGAIEFWRMQGLARQGAPMPLANPPAADWTLQASADFNHDGQADLLWRNTLTQALTIWTMNGTQPAGTLTPNPDHAADANWQLVAAQDVNGDGNVDLVWYNVTSGRVVQWLMDANVQRTVGRFTIPAQAGDANWKVVGAANYGGDSAPLVPWNDLLWRNETSGRLVVWQMNDQGQRIAGLFTTPAAPGDALGWHVVGPR